jgi:NADH-quinone oxidoreductase subunit C
MDLPKALDPAVSLQNALPDAVLATKEFRGELTLVIEPVHIIKVMRYLRDTSGLVYNFLSDISAVDYYPEYRGPSGDGRFAVSYHLYSLLYNRRLRVKVFLPEEEPTVETVTTVWPAANWLEREIADMMGVKFNGHPDPRRLLMPQDWNGHPHRRDYPLSYETVQFSFNVEEIIKHKPLAKE